METFLEITKVLSIASMLLMGVLIAIIIGGLVIEFINNIRR